MAFCAVWSTRLFAITNEISVLCVIRVLVEHCTPKRLFECNSSQGGSSIQRIDSRNTEPSMKSSLWHWLKKNCTGFKIWTPSTISMQFKWLKPKILVICSNGFCFNCWHFLLEIRKKSNVENETDSSLQNHVHCAQCHAIRCTRSTFSTLNVCVLVSTEVTYFIQFYRYFGLNQRINLPTHTLHRFIISFHVVRFFCSVRVCVCVCVLFQIFKKQTIIKKHYRIQFDTCASTQQNIECCWCFIARFVDKQMA